MKRSFAPLHEHGAVHWRLSFAVGIFVAAFSLVASCRYRRTHVDSSTCTPSPSCHSAVAGCVQHGTAIACSCLSRPRSVRLAYATPGGGVAQPLASIRGCFVIARVLCDIRNHAGMDNALVIACGIKLTMQVEIDATVLVSLPNARAKSMHDSKTGNRKINPCNV